MTIGKKLYVSFGIILATVVFLFIVNWYAVHREHDAKAAAAASLELADATNAVRFQMMQNRLYLSNYLLSGATHAVSRMSEGLSTLNGTLILAVVVAYRTAKSITEPLTNLMKVAGQIGNTGDLEHTIDVKRDDEIGELARTFAKMVVYLKEMASVSESIAGGDLTVEVKPRSVHDTLGNAFARMVEGLSAPPPHPTHTSPPLAPPPPHRRDPPHTSPHR